MFLRIEKPCCISTNNLSDKLSVMVFDDENEVSLESTKYSMDDLVDKALEIFNEL